jgi:acetyl esterase/lipase
MRFFHTNPFTLSLLVLLLFVAVAVMARPSRRTKDVAYVSPQTPGYSADRHVLDVYAPKKSSATRRPVVVFIHGGSWNSGSKNIYTFVGRRLARHNVVGVVINYRLSPAVQVSDQADDCARAVQWVTQHIGEYGGDPERVFVMGHSAGGGLAALLAADDTRFAKLGMAKNPVKGAILDDPAGLDMADYLTKMQYPGDEKYLVAFGKDPAGWRAASPVYHLTSHAPPMLLFAGGKTYPSIAEGTPLFQKRLESLGVKSKFTVVPGKKHIPMVVMLYWVNNIIYKQLDEFVATK